MKQVERYVILFLTIMVVGFVYGCAVSQISDLSDSELPDESGMQSGKGPVEELPLKVEQSQQSQQESSQQESSMSVKEFIIEADDRNFYPGQIQIKKGDKVKITFMVREDGTYYGGLDIRGEAWGDTGKIARGGSKIVEFTSDKTFVFRSYWPATNELKASGSVLVR